MIKKIFNSSRGFTVLESIVAIAVLSLSVAGVFSAVQQSLSQAIIAKDEVKAFYLAQEAIEIIRNKRDTNQLSKINTGSGNWLDGIVGVSDCSIGGICKVDAYAADKIQSCVTNCENLRQNQTTFLYGYDGSWVATNFKREIQIESINANEISVTVRISWTKGSLPPFVFKAKTHLFNWI